MPLGTLEIKCNKTVQNSENTLYIYKSYTPTKNNLEPTQIPKKMEPWKTDSFESVLFS